MQTKISRLSATICLLAGILCLPGCAGYRLGSMLPDDIKTVAVPTFINRTSEPTIEMECTAATIRQLQQDGSLRVASESHADTVLEVVLTSYTLSPVGYDTERTSTVNEYRMQIAATLMLRRTSNQAIVAQATGIVGESTFVMAGDMTSSKSRALPATARDLARRLVEKVVEAW